MSRCCQGIAVLSLPWASAFLAPGSLAVRKTQPHRVWTIAEAKACLSEILQLAESEGPQRIGVRKAFVVVPAHVWAATLSARR